MPLVARLWSATTQLVCVTLPKLLTPLADRLVRHLNSARCHHFFHISVAEGEAKIEPDTVADDLSWETMVFVGDSRR